jgi:hypothetical protein
MRKPATQKTVKKPKPSRVEEARRTVKEHAKDLREGYQETSSQAALRTTRMRSLRSSANSSRAQELGFRTVLPNSLRGLVNALPDPGATVYRIHWYGLLGGCLMVGPSMNVEKFGGGARSSFGSCGKRSTFAHGASRRGASHLCRSIQVDGSGRIADEIAYGFRALD